MNPTTQNAVKITKADLVKQRNSADGLLKSVSWSVTPTLDENDPSAYMRQMSKRNETLNITSLVQAIDASDELLSDAQLHTLRAIRGALQVARHVAYNYRERAGVPASAEGLSETLKTEVQEKQVTAGAIAAFVMARYLLWDMQSLVSGNVFLGSINVTVAEVEIKRPMPALGCATFYLAKNIEREVNGDDARLVAAVYRYAELLQEKVLALITPLKHLEAFTQITYLLEDTEFSVSGFDAMDFGVSASVEFNRVEMEQIVGNADAKHFARRMVMRMLCYNLQAQRNIFTELGGLSPVWMGYGKPGTGKSMLIAAVATMFKDYCDALGIPFLFNPLPDNIIDSYQGNSAKNMVAWMKAAHDPSRIVFMPVDDAENILEERTRQGVSEGVRAAIGVFLRYTEGAYAINRGNASVGVFTNLPEQIDAAVRSRIQGRMVIDGADTVPDFLDQDYIWFKKFADQAGFNNLTRPDYDYMSAQGELKSMSEAAQTRDEPEHQTVHDIFTDVAFKFDVNAHDFFANLYMAFMKRFGAFSSRDVRNIQSAVDQRIMDFDLPEEWFENPETFCLLDYDRQKEMVIDLRNQNMQGLQFADIYRQEAIRYLDNYARIADAQFDRQVHERIEQHRIMEAVSRRVNAN